MKEVSPLLTGTELKSKISDLYVALACDMENRLRR